MPRSPTRAPVRIRAGGEDKQPLPPPKGEAAGPGKRWRPPRQAPPSAAAASSMDTTEILLGGQETPHPPVEGRIPFLSSSAKAGISSRGDPPLLPLWAASDATRRTKRRCSPVSPPPDRPFKRWGGAPFCPGRGLRSSQESGGHPPGPSLGAFSRQHHRHAPLGLRPRISRESASEAERRAAAAGSQPARHSSEGLCSRGEEAAQGPWPFCCFAAAAPPGTALGRPTWLLPGEGEDTGRAGGRGPRSPLRSSATGRKTMREEVNQPQRSFPRKRQGWARSEYRRGRHGNGGNSICLVTGQEAPSRSGE